MITYLHGSARGSSMWTREVPYKMKAPVSAKPLRYGRIPTNVMVLFNDRWRRVYKRRNAHSFYINAPKGESICVTFVNVGLES